MNNRRSFTAPFAALMTLASAQVFNSAIAAEPAADSKPVPVPASRHLITKNIIPLPHQVPVIMFGDYSDNGDVAVTICQIRKDGMYSAQVERSGAQMNVVQATDSREELVVSGVSGRVLDGGQAGKNTLESPQLSRLLPEGMQKIIPTENDPDNDAISIVQTLQKNCVAAYSHLRRNQALEKPSI